MTTVSLVWIRDAGKGAAAAAAAAAATAAMAVKEEGTQGTSRQRDFTGVWRAVSCDGLHSYLAAAGVVEGEGKRAIVQRMGLPVHDLRMYDESRLRCTVVGMGEDGTRTTLEQRAGEAVSHTNEYNVATTEIARWEGNTWVVEVTNVKTGARSQQRRWLEGQNTMRFVRLPETILTLSGETEIYWRLVSCAQPTAQCASVAVCITMRGEVAVVQTTRGMDIPWLADMLWPHLSPREGSVVISARCTSAAVFVTMRGEVEQGETTRGMDIPWLADMLWPHLSPCEGSVVISARCTSAAVFVTMRGEVEEGQTTRGMDIPWLADMLWPHLSPREGSVVTSSSASSLFLSSLLPLESPSSANPMHRRLV
jgi:hypothetical protein